jgi:hypothetical protein
VTDAAREVVGTIYVLIGSPLSKTGKPAEALESYHEALAIRLALAQAKPPAADLRDTLVAVHNNIGNLHSESGRPGEAP